MSESLSPAAQGPAAQIYRFPRLAWCLLAAAFAVALLTFRASLGSMWGMWLGLEEYSHAILIPPIVAFLTWQRRDRLSRVEFAGSWWGVAVIALAAAIKTVGSIATLFVLQQLALLLLIYGLVLALGGWRLFRLLGVPMLLLLFMVPLPQFLLKNLSAQLQLASSQIGVQLIRACDISVFIQGNVIDLGVYQLEVADACSGLRYLFPLMTLGLIIAYLYKAPLWQRAAVFVSTVPVTILMNSFRVGVIGLLVDRWGADMARGALHDFEGWIVFMASVGVLVVEVALLNRLNRPRRPLRAVFGLERPMQTAAGARSIVGPMPRPLIAGTVLLVFFAAATDLVPARDELIPAHRQLVDFPSQLGGWQGHQTAMDPVYLNALRLDDYLLEDFSGSPASGGSRVNLYIAWYNSQAAGESVHSPRSCIPGGGWRITDFSQRTVEGVRAGAQPLRVNRAVIEYGEQRELVYYWFQQRGRIITDEYAVKWFLFRDALARRRSDGALVRLIVPLQAGQGAEQADAQLQSFAALLEPLLPPYIPD